MRLYEFKDYEHYVAVQTACNRSKLDKTWVGPSELDAISAAIRRLVPRATFGICHGVRNGSEVAGLRARLGFEVIGTDIADTAPLFENVEQWDFHDLKAAWIGRAGFVYSNSLDHSYDPALAVRAWTLSLETGGICILHWSTGHDYPEFANDGADCFAGTKEDYCALLTAHFHAVEIIPLEPRGEGHEAEQCLIVGKEKRR